ncbi:hypothetical protein GCM10027044_02260 [Hymenobacter ruber]
MGTSQGKPPERTTAQTSHPKIPTENSKTNRNAPDGGVELKTERGGESMTRPGLNGGK